MEMIKHPETRTPIAVLTIAVLIASAWTPAFAGQRPAWSRTAADADVHSVAFYEADGNPLDRVGIEHNVYLGCLMRDGGDTTVSPLQRVVEECGYKPGISTDDFAARYSSLVDTDPFKTVAERMGPYRESYTDYQFSFFERIDRVIATAQDQAEADAMFAQLEKEASARLTTDTTAEQSILAALSTARHSLQYWSQVPPTGASAQKLRWWVKVLAVVGADLLGAAGGTLIGGPVVGAATGSASSAGAASVLK
jgi:hypothetical protein